MAQIKTQDGYWQEPLNQETAACPICGGKNMAAQYCAQWKRVICLDCGANAYEMGWMDTISGAIKAWALWAAAKKAAIANKTARKAA